MTINTIVLIVIKEEPIKMKVSVNGREVSVDNKTTLIDLLDRLGTDKLKTVVQLSGDIVRREKLSGKKLKEGDAIEIISIVGGG